MYVAGADSGEGLRGGGVLRDPKTSFFSFKFSSKFQSHIPTMLDLPVVGFQNSNVRDTYS